MKKATITLASVLFALVMMLPLAPAGAKRYSEWSVPANLGSAVNSTLMDSCPSVTKDGLSLYFMKMSASYNMDLYVSQRPSIDSSWGTPQDLGPVVNSSGMERCPYVTPDGHYLIFVGGQPGNSFVGDFYISYRHDKKDNLAWETPVNITAINTPYDVYAMWGFEEEDSNLLRLYFSTGIPVSEGGIGGQDIYTTIMTEDAVFSPPVLVSELSTALDDIFPVVRKDGLEMFLTSKRPGGLGGWDIWTSTRESTSDPWSTPTNLGPTVNGATNDMRAALSWDASTIIFRSDRLGGYGSTDLWQSTRSKVTGPKD
jgi:hypothetical protein